MELIEKIAAPMFKAGLGPCPFKLEGPLVGSLDEENVKNDDKSVADHDGTDTMDEPQGNNGGILGENLAKKGKDAWGAPGTWNDVHPPPEVKKGIQRADSHPDSIDPSLRVTVDGDEHPFIVAAHHLIPGNASLFPSELYIRYMVKAGTKVKKGSGEVTGGYVTTKSGKKSVETHIGYNVNGSHNGVWLPGNYAIRSKNPDNKWKKTWSKLFPSKPDWCWDYMNACIKKAKGQFHDTHTDYNEAAKKKMNEVFDKLKVHQDTCTECQGKTKIFPPYPLKHRLYWFSGHLRGKVRKRPKKKWEMPWCTSDKFQEMLVAAKIVKREPAAGPR